MQRIGSTPLPGTNPFEGKTAVDTATNASPAPFQPTTSSDASPCRTTCRLPSPRLMSAPYVAPYGAPGAPSGAAARRWLRAAATVPICTARASRARPPPRRCSRIRGKIAQPYQPAYPHADSKRSRISQAYPQQGYQQAPAPYPAQDPYVSTPWPMSPAARARSAGEPGGGEMPPPASNAKRSTSKKQASTARAAQASNQYGATADLSASAVSAAAAGLSQQPYTPQPQPYAQQPYAQPQPYAAARLRPAAIHSAAAGRLRAAVQPAAGAARRAALRLGAAFAAAVASAQTLGVAEELAQINREQASTVSGGIVFRSRDGEDGLSNLTDIEAPIEGRIKAGNGHVVVRATPVTLDAGTASRQPQTLARFGSGLGAAAQRRRPTTTARRRRTGVGLSVGYENRNIKGDVGSTPLGFRETTVVGGVQYQNAITDKVSYSRRRRAARRHRQPALLRRRARSGRGPRMGRRDVERRARRPRLGRRHERRLRERGVPVPRRQQRREQQRGEGRRRHLHARASRTPTRR